MTAFMVTSCAQSEVLVRSPDNEALMLVPPAGASDVPLIAPSSGDKLTIVVGDDVVDLMTTQAEVKGYRWTPDNGNGGYANDNIPRFDTEEELVATAALDLRDILTRTVCGGSQSLTYSGTGTGVLPYSGDPTCAFDIVGWTDFGSTDALAIVVGRPEDFGYTSPFQSVDQFNREQHLVRTTGNQSILALGAEGAGVVNAVNRVLKSLGYAYLMPPPSWEVFPDPTDLTVEAINSVAGPSHNPEKAGFVARTVSGGEGNGDLKYQQDAWALRNGYFGAFQVNGNQGQYTDVADNDEAWFLSNPGSVATAGGVVPSDNYQWKFCPDYSSVGVTVAQRIYTEYAEIRLDEDSPAAFQNPYTNQLTRDMLLLHHGDANFWHSCGDNQSPTDRAVLLANQLAQEARTAGTLDDRFISVFGYGAGRLAPVGQTLDDDVAVYLHAGDNSDGTVLERLSGWKARGAHTITQHLTWRVDGAPIPDESAGAQAVRVHAQLLMDLLDEDVVGLEGEIGTSGWGTDGLFKWVLFTLARTPGLATTDVDGAVDGLIDDLLEVAFPAGARTGVEAWIGLMDGSQQRILLSGDLVAEMYDHLGAAHAATITAGDASAQTRVEDLLVYTRYLEHYLAYEGSGADADLTALIDHVYCEDPRRMVDYDSVWAIADQTAYTTANGDPPDLVNGTDRSSCVVADFADWIDSPTALVVLPSTTEWYVGPEGDYVRPNATPGTAGIGGWEHYLHSGPSEREVWKIRMDPQNGVEITGACRGVKAADTTITDTTGLWHRTRRMLGFGGFELRSEDGETTICSASIPPHKGAMDVTFAATGATVVDPATVGPTTCRDEPVVASIDTALDTGIDVSCDTGLFSGEGVYSLVMVNDHEGTDYERLAGSSELGVARWKVPFGGPEVWESKTLSGSHYRYFYVPVGVDEFYVWSDGKSCTLYGGNDGSEAYGFDLSGAPGYHQISTETADLEAHDGTVWAMTGCIDTYLVDIPPIVSPTRELMMVDCDFVQAHERDAYRLGLDTSDTADTGLDATVPSCP